MELTQLHYFRTVAETGKISQAAEKLFLSAPALSASIARLEKELGTRLFDRSNNRITLNHQGQIFLRYVQQVFSALDCAKVELRQSTILQEQCVGVATLWSNLWAQMMTDFYQAHPGVPLSSAVLRPEQLEPLGLLSQYTFLLAEEGEVPPRLLREMESTLLFRDGPAVMVHPAHPLADREDITLTQLERENVMLPVSNTAFRRRLDRLFAARGLPALTGTENPFLVYHHMAEQGLGMYFTTAHSGHSQGLRCLPVRELEACWGMRAFWWKNRPLTKDGEIFLDFLREYYRAPEEAQRLL